LVNRYSTSQQIATRARIILLADDGQNHRQIARELDISRDMARTWRHRWLELQERELPPSERLQDAERSGAPATLVWSKWLVFALACIEPSNYGRAISHWTERIGG